MRSMAEILLIVAVLVGCKSQDKSVATEGDASTPLGSARPSTTPIALPSGSVSAGGPAVLSQPFPTGAAGFRFGEATQQTRGHCQRSGGKFVSNPLKAQSFRCDWGRVTHTHAAGGDSFQIRWVSGQFCGGKLCGLLLGLGKLPTSELDRIKGLMRAEYGPPAGSFVPQRRCPQAPAGETWAEFRWKWPWWDPVRKKVTRFVLLDSMCTTESPRSPVVLLGYADAPALEGTEQR
ncbi:hypothetical protein ACFL5O_10025 [Myxococcota bacterium]